MAASIPIWIVATCLHTEAGEKLELADVPDDFEPDGFLAVFYSEDAAKHFAEQCGGATMFKGQEVMPNAPSIVDC